MNVQETLILVIG